MYNVLFVCYGNICRSPMAEMIFKNIIEKNNKRYLISCISRATSIEEIGNDIYPKVKEILKENNIPIERHQAKQIKKEDYNKYDLIIVMDFKNKEDVLNIVGNDINNKVHLLMEYTGKCCEIEDPWYTNNFSKVFNLINEGCNSLYLYLIKKGDGFDN